MRPKLPNSQLRQLKAAAQRLKASFKVGQAGLSPEFVESLDTALGHQELLKVRFEKGKAQKKELAALLADRTSSHLIMLVGHVAVFYRPHPKNQDAGQGTAALALVGA